MDIIVVGDGKVGYTLAKNLSEEQHNVTVIDKNPAALQKAGETLDVMTVLGNGASVGLLRQAGIDRADLLIAATRSDELNMMCCLLGKKLGAKHTVARIRDPEYANELAMISEEMELDLVINPEQAAAKEILRALQLSSGIFIDSFASGRVELVKIQLKEGDKLPGKSLEGLSRQIPKKVLFCAIQSGNDMLIPDGGYVLKTGDVAYILGEKPALADLFRYMGHINAPVRKVMVIGGGRIAQYLAQRIVRQGVHVTIIESDPERCLELSEALPDALIIEGDGTDQELLNSENIDGMDAFIALTGRDEDNLMASLFALHSGAQRVIVKIDRSNYNTIIKDLGINSVISPKEITANMILRFVRALVNPRGFVVQTLDRITSSSTEVLEFLAEDEEKIFGRPLSELRIMKNTLIAVIVRGNRAIIPRGDDVIHKGDHIIAVTKQRGITSLSKLVG